MNKRSVATLAMLVGAMIWGAAFVFQSKAMDHIGPFTLGAIRFLMGSIVVSPLLFVKKMQPDPATDAPFSEYLKAGVICGIALFGGVTFQQLGILYTTAGKAGFVTALYMVMVPFFAALFFRRRIKKVMWLIVLVALFGTFLLCFSGPVTFSSGELRGDMLVLVGSVFWAFQILLLEKFGRNLDSIKLAIVQFMTCAILSGVCMFFFDSPAPSWSGIMAAAGPILYCGILSVGVAFTAQVICLKHADAIVATLVMSTESVFSAIFGFLLLGELLTAKQMIGCALVFAAVVSSEILPKLTNRRAV